jgi:DNA modification methylase
MVEREEKGKYIGMRLVTFDEYLKYVREHPKVKIGNAEIEVGRPHNISHYQPKSFSLETTTVWSFPDRGDWATHKGNYRGNWSPYIPRNLILRYSKPGETVLDQMCGAGTTLVEAKLLGRNAIGVDINYEAVILTLDRLNFPDGQVKGGLKPTIKVYHGDARNLDLIEDESIDLIATHPPYYNIIPYSRTRVEGDLSRLKSIDKYFQGIKEVAVEAYRVLRPGRYAAILIGDTRMGRHYVPIAFRVMQQFLEAGFILKEDIIKLQWKTKTTRERWTRIVGNEPASWVSGTEKDKKRHMDFYLISHEHLFIFRKPSKEERIEKYRNSMKWW